jgi:hypothetical protein
MLPTQLRAAKVRLTHRVKTEVKHPGTGNIANQMSKAAQQGVDQVIIDGSTVGLTEEQVRGGIDKYEARTQEMVAGESRQPHPKLRDLKTAFIVKGDADAVAVGIPLASCPEAE